MTESSYASRLLRRRPSRAAVETNGIKFSLPGVHARGPRRLELIERLTLTPQHSVCLVRVADKAMLIGLSPSQCTLLDGVSRASIEGSAAARVSEVTR